MASQTKSTLIALVTGNNCSLSNFRLLIQLLTQLFEILTSNIGRQPWSSSSSTNCLSSLMPSCPIAQHTPVNPIFQNSYSAGSGQNFRLRWPRSRRITNCLSNLIPPRSNVLLLLLTTLVTLIQLGNTGWRGVNFLYLLKWNNRIWKYLSSKPKHVREEKTSNKSANIFILVCTFDIEIGLGPNWPFPGAVQCDLFSITPNSHFTEIT